MDALALLCNLHGDGPETLRRLRAVGCLDLAQVGDLPRTQLDRLLGRGSLAAERFRREGQLLEKRLAGEPSRADGVAATGTPSRSKETRELRDWADSGREEPGGGVDESSDILNAGGAGDAAEPGGLVHPFPPRKSSAALSPQAKQLETGSSGSVLEDFIARWRGTPKESVVDARPAKPVSAGTSAEGPSAIRQLAEWAQQTRSNQTGNEAEADSSAQSVQDRATIVERSEPEQLSASAGTRTQSAPPLESAPLPRTSGRALELLDHGATQSTEKTAAQPSAPRPLQDQAPRSEPPAQPEPSGEAAAGTPLGHLPGGERCGPSLEALAFAGLTCLEDLVQASARQLAERSGLAYTEVLRLQFLAERHLSRN